MRILNRLFRQADGDGGVTVAVPLAGDRELIKESVPAPAGETSEAQQEREMQELLAKLQSIGDVIGLVEEPAPKRHPEALEMKLALRDVIHFLPRHIKSDLQEEADELATVTISIPEAAQQLRRGRIQVSLANLVFQIPDAWLAPDFRDHLAEMVTVPLPLIVGSIAPEFMMKGQREPMAPTLALDGIPDLFGPGETVQAAVEAACPPVVVPSAPVVVPQSVDTGVRAGDSAALMDTGVEAGAVAHPTEVQVPAITADGAEAPDARVPLSVEATEPPSPEAVPLVAELAAAGVEPVMGESCDPGDVLARRVAPLEAVRLEALAAGELAKVQRESSRLSANAAKPEVSRPMSPVSLAPPARPVAVPRAVSGASSVEGGGDSGMALRIYIANVNINAASPKELQTKLNGVGMVLAHRIVAHRPYASLQDLLKVPGISRGLFMKITGEAAEVGTSSRNAVVDPLLAADEGGGAPSLDVVLARAVQTLGLHGCIVSHADGCPLASAWRTSAQPAVGAIAPQIFKQLVRYFELLKMDAPQALTLYTHPRPVFISRRGDIFLIAFLSRGRCTSRRLSDLERLNAALAERFTERLSADGEVGEHAHAG